jgi:hypothetical protein
MDRKHRTLIRVAPWPLAWRGWCFRLLAAGDLARLRDRTVVPALVAAMQDDAGTRRTCVMAQSPGAIGDSNAVPALLQAIHHPRNRWLARYIQVMETERQNVDAFARSDLTKHLTMSTLSP